MTGAILKISIFILFSNIMIFVGFHLFEYWIDAKMNNLTPNRSE